MRIRTIVLVFMISGIINTTEAQNWQWAKGVGGIGGDNGKSICADNDGNIYVALSIMKTTAYFQTDSFTVNGFNDIFLSKYDGSGNELWVKQFGGPNTNMFDIKIENVIAVVFDSIANVIFVSGNFFSSCNFGSCNLTGNSLEGFIAKFDLSGNCLWAKSAGGSGDDLISSFAINQDGSLITSAYIEYSGAFDTINVTGGEYFAKYAADGACLWIKKIFNKESGSVNSLLIHNNDIYSILLNYEDTLTIDTILIQASDYYGLIFARFDSIGNIKLAKIFGGPGNKLQGTNAGKIESDSQDNFYVLGIYYGNTATFDDDTLNSSANRNFYLAKFDEVGNKIWLTQAENSTIYTQGIDIHCDIEGNAVITGDFKGNATFGNFNITSDTSPDMFIAKYDSSGNCLGITHTGKAIGIDITSDVNGNYYVAGDFNDTINFGTTQLVTHSLNPDAFIAKHDSSIFTSINARIANTSSQLLIYANPNTGKCNITVPDEFSKEENLTLRIFDNTGKLIQEQTVEMYEDKVKVNLEAEAKGIYNVTLSNKKKSYAGKIIFE